ncbi:hypothetical protein AURDEDRAFT_113630 [Auricularia subglabra TFB-10046 SS5]|nr:hypothetical protein AURDEDRAFT_113630 [Auricularia subglabra TFB-10046 SS5]
MSLRVSRLLSAYPALQSVVVRSLRADVHLEGLKRLFIFDSLTSEAPRAVFHNVTHLHIDVAAALSFHALSKTHPPATTFVALRCFSITLRIEDVRAGHYDQIISDVVRGCLKLEHALLQVVFGSSQDGNTAPPRRFSLGQKLATLRALHHVLRHALFAWDAVELWRRDAWGESRGVWHNNPPPMLSWKK